MGLYRDLLRDEWRKKYRWKKARVLINDPVMAERDRTLHKERRRELQHDRVTGKMD